MKEMTDKIREIATRLLQEGQVDVFIAWTKGELPFQTKPYFARSIEDINNIVFDEYSIHNLSGNLMKFRDSEEKIGIVVKGCDSRGVVRILEDNQFKRDRLYIVGVCCPGMKDPLAASRNNSGFNLKKQEEGTATKCLNCTTPNPVIYDELIGQEQSAHLQGERFAKVKELENMSYNERYQFWTDTLSACIRCYACRQVCPACNCRTCIFDEMKPQWVGRENNETDNMMYHLVRASHMAGRCVECGECERICPVNIPLMLINQKLAKDVGELFGPYEAGMKYEEGAKPALSVYNVNDPDNFL